MSSPYFDFAQIYDACMEEVPYEAWTRSIARRFSQYGVTAGDLVLDLGCGTGNLTLILRDLCYDMIAVDGSEAMLAQARDKYYERLADEEEDNGRKPVLFLQQDMQSFELYGTVRAIVSVCDTMNYAADLDQLTDIFRLVNNYLDPGGVFIFDIKTPYYYADVAGDRTFSDVREDMALIWENEYDAENKKNTYRLTMFIEKDDKSATYERSEEVHVQTVFSVEEVKRALAKAGLALMEIYAVSADGAEQDITASAERLFFVCREQMKKVDGERG